MKKLIKYANKTEHWEKWFHEYKYGAFYIFPPEEIMKSVDKLRQAYDPKSAKFCRAHISLSEPLNREITTNDIEKLAIDIKTIERFEIIYGPIRTHLPYPGITLAITPEDKFNTLRTTLHRNEIFSGATIKRSHIAPHMTIAEFITIERTNQLFQELINKIPSGIFWCNEITFAVPNNKFHFEPVFSIPLG